MMIIVCSNPYGWVAPTPLPVAPPNVGSSVTWNGLADSHLRLETCPIGVPQGTRGPPSFGSYVYVVDIRSIWFWCLAFILTESDVNTRKMGPELFKAICMKHDSGVLLSSRGATWAWALWEWLGTPAPKTAARVSRRSLVLPVCCRVSLKSVDTG
jgi:hypothetical protein